MNPQESIHEEKTKQPVNASVETESKEKSNSPADLEAGVRQNETVDGEPAQEEEDTYLHGLPLVLMTLSLMLLLSQRSQASSIVLVTLVTWYASAYLLTQMSFQPTFGKIYTFFNLKWVYLISSIIFEGGSILCAAAPSSPAFIIGRAISGLGAAGIFCGAMIIISKIVEMRKRPLLLAIISSMYGIASVIGPSLGGVFTHSKQLTWRFCFWINLPSDGDHTLKEKILGLGLKSAAILAGTLICLFLALQWGGTKHPWSDSRVWGCLLGFSLLLMLFVYIQVRQGEAALIRPRIISQRSVFLGCLFSALYQGAMTTQTYHLPFYFQAVKGVDPQTSGVDILPHGVTVTVATLITGSIITWLGYYVPFMWAGSAIFTTGAGLLYTISQNTPMARWFGYEVLAGAGFGIAIQIPIFAVQVVLDAGDIPLGTVLIILSQALGGSVGLSISQNVFQNSLRQRLKTIPDIDVQAVIAAGGTDLEHAVSADSLAYVRDAFRYGISNAFLVSTALGSVAFLASIGMERKRIKSKKEGVDLYKTARPFDVSIFSSRGSIDTKMTLAKVAFTLVNLVAVGSAAKNVADGFVAAPYYPAPYGGWDESWAASYARAKKMVDSMTLAEKTNITAGTGLFMGKKDNLSPCNGNTGSADRVGFPQLCLNDAANGVRLADNVTVFPDGITAGATFDKKLMYERGVAIGKEARGKGVNVWLGPSVGPIGRKPKGGRNWEGFGADPALQGIGARETIKGVQEQGVIATVKHLIGNEQEMYRRQTTDVVSPAYSANIDDRTMHELYLWPFAEAVKVGVGATMTAYNRVNGTISSEHSYLINALLKEELGFQGFVMTDWLSQITGVQSAIAGMDMSMPGDPIIPLFGRSLWMYELTRSALNGSVPMSRLNDMATRIVATWYQFEQDKDFPSVNFDTNTYDRVGPLYPAAWPNSPSGVVNQYVQVQDDHDEIARQIAQDAITLLKNDDKLLPLSTKSPLKVFGTGAQTNPDGANACVDRSCNKGTLGQGWGSGTVDYMYLDDPIGAIKKEAGDVTFYNTDKFPSVPSPSGDDVAIVFVTSDSGENQYTVEGNNGDRNADKLNVWHNGDALIKAAADKYKNVVVVIHTVGPVLVDQWIDLPSVKAVLVAHLPGQEAGKSLTNILFGEVSPSGHLPYSITKKEEDMPESVTKLIDSGFVDAPQDTYSEGLFIDYRWLNKEKIRPRYAFGHGLSYTNFTYTNATIKRGTQLSQYPPKRPAKGKVLDYSQDIPDYKEAIKPSSFKTVWRYLYSWLSESDAKSAAAKAETSKYPYPDGYSTAQKTALPKAGGVSGGNPALWDEAYTLSVVVTNAGSKFSGKASVQAYVQFPSVAGYETPTIQLRDFEKTKVLEPGSSETVQLTLTRKDLSVWDVKAQDWLVLDGEFKIWLGSASDKLDAVCFTDDLGCEHDVKGPVSYDS
ncbi:glycosyl hydrolase family 3 N terminal domain-containing protein [Fusarium redolens]|uniref:beta-glucosidase n=1 Tax=Fusarium redolens TaxID=48865 RepID=A0A9P9GDV3_FUSRE|nr:glycosyl hydrolase family 3 N terminal domain-containing protein [Fusarium redolens]KAH7236732.1 glycosyl hydrolase family 3 N terminal domain-containing protein [Fusarium redolens]